jgi:hypothetical protein
MMVEKSTVGATSEFIWRMYSPFISSSDVVDRLKFFALFITLKHLSAEATEEGRLKKILSAAHKFGKNSVKFVSNTFCSKLTGVCLCSTLKFVL